MEKLPLPSSAPTGSLICQAWAGEVSGESPRPLRLRNPLHPPRGTSSPAVWEEGPSQALCVSRRLLVPTSPVAERLLSPQVFALCEWGFPEPLPTPKHVPVLQVRDAAPHCHD